MAVEMRTGHFVYTHYLRQVNLIYLLNIDFDGPVVVLIKGFEGTLDLTKN